MDASEPRESITLDERVAAWCAGEGALSTGLPRPPPAALLPPEQEPEESHVPPEPLVPQMPQMPLVPLVPLVIVGCSGGADSVCLLAALSSLPLRLRAVYVDHGLREGTDAEAALVAAVAARVGAGFERIAVDVERRGNLLAAARTARYAALAAAARRAGAAAVAVGHTATDQAETVAFRRLRGDPEHALAGMPVRRPLDGPKPRQRPGEQPLVLLRPLLGAGVRREEAEAYVRARALPFVSDPTNLDARFTRVRLRANLQSEGPAATDALLALAADQSARFAADDAAAARLGDPADLPADAVASASTGVLLRLLRRAGLHRAGLAHARALAALASGTVGSARIDLGRGADGVALQAERRYHRLHLGPVPAPVADAVVPVEGPGSYRLLGRRFVLSLQPAGASPTVADGPFAALDASVLDGGFGPLVLRNLRAGDRLRCPQGGRKLHDVLIDRKVPRGLRRQLALLAPADGRDLLWVEGVGPSHEHRATSASAVHLIIMPLESVGHAMSEGAGRPDGPALSPTENSPAAAGGDG